MKASEPRKDGGPAGIASGGATAQMGPGWDVVQRMGQPGGAGKGNVAARRYAGVTPRSKPAGPAPGTTVARTPQSMPPQAPTDDAAVSHADALTRPADAIIVVIASKGGKELGRWEGPMDYSFELPARFTAKRAGAGWVWSDKLGAGINIQSQDRHKGGISLTKWARRLGAKEIEIVLIPHPGSAEPDAGKRGYGTHGQGQGGDQPEGDSSADGHRAEIAPGSGTRAQDGAGEDGDDVAPIEDLVTGGMGKQGPGSAASGASGREDAHGQGATLRSAGHEEGSENPSWNEAPGAAIDNEHGGRTPTEHGQLGGSAGGEQGGKGRVLGSGWLNVIDAPEEIAPAVTIGILLADANVANLGKGLFEKAIKRLARETLEQEIERTIRTALRSAMRAQKRQLRQVKSFRTLSTAEQTRILKDMEKQAELELYERLQKYAHRKADEYERAAAKVADESDEQGRRSRELAEENAAAYREIEEACAQKTGGSVKARPSEAEARHPYDPHRTREELEADYPGEVESATVPPTNKPNVKLRGSRNQKSGTVHDARGFPIFDDVAVYDTRLPSTVWSQDNSLAHMRAATRDLRAAIQNGRVGPNRFTPEQLDAIEKGQPQIPGYTWHHHQEPGRMQLVPRTLHQDTKHVGGNKMWPGEP
jgi:hypothetical protein